MGNYGNKENGAVQRLGAGKERSHENEKLKARKARKARKVESEKSEKSEKSGKREK
ncbi:MAG: hypothetical protein WCV67_09210 [Victivallaceae bacterium]|jgi:hypothetical protein